MGVLNEPSNVALFLIRRLIGKIIGIKSWIVNSDLKGGESTWALFTIQDLTPILLLPAKAGRFPIRLKVDCFC